MHLQVLLETDELVAVDKPMGALSVPSRMGRADPRPCVLYALSAARGRNFLPIHRLDEEVSGVLLFAKTAEAHRRLNTMFETRAVTKEYEAWTEQRPGALPPASSETQRLEDRLHRGKKRAFPAAHGKPAITEARLVGVAHFQGREYLRWSLRPLTGRSHQLRVQLALRGFPILGDTLYGAIHPFLAGGIALRAVRLEFGLVVAASPLATLTDERSDS